MPLLSPPTQVKHSALVVHPTSPGGKLRGRQMPLSGTRIGKDPWMTAQLPSNGQFPVWLPVQHASGVLAAVQMRFGSQPLQGRPSLPDGPVVQVIPLYGPPAQVFATLHVPPPRHPALTKQLAPGFEPPTHVPRQFPCEPPPGATMRWSALVVGVAVRVGVRVGVLVSVGVLVMVGVLVIVGESVGVRVSVGVLV